MAEPLFDQLALIGIGLIGSSIALAARQNGLVREIAVQTRSQKTLDRARELGLGDFYTLDPAEAVAGADLVIVCVPVGASEAVAEAIAPALKPGAIVSDVGSVKTSVVRADGAASAERTCISCRRIRSPAPSIPARTPASPSCSRTAGRS